MGQHIGVKDTGLNSVSVAARDGVLGQICVPWLIPIPQEDFLSATNWPDRHTLQNCPDLSEFPGEHTQAAKLGFP